jgi:[acyl-carrier-protein] S-malonyltransferase
MSSGFGNPRIAFLFPGQGSQSVGMGRDFIRHNSRFESVFDDVSRYAGHDILKYCVRGPISKLSRTDILQPAVTAVNICALMIVRDMGIVPCATAGHSLGELSALVAAGSMQISDALKLSVIRGRLMHEAALVNPGTMAAVSGVSESQIDACLRQLNGTVKSCIANYNAPDQLVLSGPVQEMNRLKSSILKLKGRWVQLNVSGAWHSILMQGITSDFEMCVSKVEISRPETAFYQNVSGKICRSPRMIRCGLISQLTQPVLWIQIIRNMLESGVTRFVEIGPGAVLSRLMRKICPDPSRYEIVTLGSVRSIQQFVDHTRQSG